MENPLNKTNKSVFDIYEKLKEIISEYESDLDAYDKDPNNENNDESKDKEEVSKIVSLTLRKIIFISCCELSSYFMDNVFLISKLKFQNFSDNKSFEKVLEDILYQIAKQLNTFSFRAIINLFETMQIGNFQNDSMIFFLKVLLTFYYTHTRSLMRLPESVNKFQYEVIFKQNFDKGLNDMNSLLKLIPLVELTDNADDELISIVLRIDDIPDNFSERPSTTASTTSLPPVKTGRSINKNPKKENLIKNSKTEFNNVSGIKLENSKTENFFTTELKK